MPAPARVTFALGRPGLTFLPYKCVLSWLSVFIFFFSSRRRHTRCLSDWSSDVCSSDLRRPGALAESRRGLPAVAAGVGAEDGVFPPCTGPVGSASCPPVPPALGVAEIGRASCRESVKLSPVAVP